MNDRLKKLYKTVILKHNNEPFHFAKQEGQQHRLEAYNPLCGDRFDLFLDIKENKIAALYFHGYGCAISKASTSILVKNLNGQTVEKALELCQSFAAVIHPESETIKENEKEEFEAFAAARDFPGRLKCASLSWEAMTAFLKEGQ
jgi:nitrogen fixation NifU-like protein